MEESEKYIDQELGLLWEKFCTKETGIGAKYLWLEYTKSKQDVPENVMKKMIEIIEYDIQLYKDQGYTSYDALSKKEIEKPIFMLLNLAINNSDKFWEILYAPDKNILLACQFDEDLLEKTRIAFPHKRKLKPGELYDFFGKQLGMKQEESGEDIGERMRYRYRTYKKNKKTEELLFE